MKHFFFSFLISTFLLSCNNKPAGTAENSNLQRDTIKTDFTFAEKKDTLIQNGEYIKYYKSGKIEMQGMMKNGKRGGTWKSLYEGGNLWSETLYAAGKKNGKSTNWYENSKKRYEGFYTNDRESGKWSFWDENGKVQSTKNY